MILLVALVFGFGFTWLRALFGIVIYEKVRRATRYPTWPVCAGLLAGWLWRSGWFRCGECGAVALCGWAVVRMALAVAYAFSHEHERAAHT